jgi:hypothetical protein
LKKIKAVAATGNLSTGFLEETLVRAVQQGARFIGCDAGTTDSGPYYRGSGNPRGPRERTKRNLRIMIREALSAASPVVTALIATKLGWSYALDFAALVTVISGLAWFFIDAGGTIE